MMGTSFRYTQGGDRTGIQRYRGGTVSGGVAYLPPELSIDDYVSNYAPSRITKSTTYHVAVPGVYWAAGSPDPITGLVDSGYRWGVTNGELAFACLNSSGAVLVADALYLDNAGLVGIGESNPTSTLDVDGSTAWPTRSVIVSPYTPTTADWTLLVDCTTLGADITIQLPPAVGCTGRVYNIKKVDATAHSVIITPTPPDLIDGAATLPTAVQYKSYQIQSDGTNWQVI
jgi:hypothetical protein